MSDRVEKPKNDDIDKILSKATLTFIDYECNFLEHCDFIDSLKV